MRREWLAAQLDQGRSYEQIGQEIGRHASTVGYWAKRYGLRSQGADRYSPRGAPDRGALTTLAARGATLAEIAEGIDRSVATVRYWLARWGIERARRPGRRPVDPAIAPPIVEMKCARHGPVRFRLEARGYYRCMLCRQEAVSDRRRRVKRILVKDAGGRCVLCGYASCPAALQFHHIDRQSKLFALSRRGVTRSLAEAREEARKCVLLCANCHAEVETGYRTIQVRPEGTDNDYSPGWTRTTMT